VAKSIFNLSVIIRNYI